jgi:hypothetical protein
MEWVVTLVVIGVLAPLFILMVLQSSFFTGQVTHHLTQVETAYGDVLKYILVGEVPLSKFQMNTPTQGVFTYRIRDGHYWYGVMRD